MSEPKPTLEEIEDAIPEERKNLSFGGPDEGLIDVMEKHEKKQHDRGKHIDNKLESCPLCPDPENKHVSPTLVGDDE
jgi:hypothetical protein